MCHLWHTAAMNMCAPDSNNLHVFSGNADTCDCGLRSRAWLNSLPAPLTDPPRTRIRVVQTNSDCMRAYHTRARLRLRSLDPLRYIPGVETVESHGYCILVTRALLYSWEEVEPLVIAEIEKWIGQEKEK